MNCRRSTNSGGVQQGSAAWICAGNSRKWYRSSREFAGRTSMARSKRAGRWTVECSRPCTSNAAARRFFREEIPLLQRYEVAQADATDSMQRVATRIRVFFGNRGRACRLGAMCGGISGDAPHTWRAPSPGMARQSSAAKRTPPGLPWACFPGFAGCRSEEQHRAAFAPLALRKPRG